MPAPQDPNQESLPPKTRWTDVRKMPLAIAAAIVLLDQGTKLWVDAIWERGHSMPVVDNFFDLVHWRNTGAAWGIFGNSTLALGIVSAVAFVMVVLFFDKLTDRKTLPAILVSILAGGIFGNMIDRLFYGSVIDFLDFHWYSHHFPAFNVADTAICCSIFGLILLTLIDTWRSRGTSDGQ